MLRASIRFASQRPSQVKPSAQTTPLQPRQPAGGFTQLGVREHVVNLLKRYDRQTLPLDLHIKTYLSKQPELVDDVEKRQELTRTVYGLVTWQGLLSHLADPSGLQLPTWEARVDQWQRIATDPLRFVQDSSIPGAARASLPEYVFKKLTEQYDEPTLWNLIRASNTPPPLTVRANPLKISRTDLLQLFSDKYRFRVAPTQLSPHGVLFLARPTPPVQLLAEFAAGLFEVQDESSQLVAARVAAQPGEKVLDFCAGAGGKSLAFGPRLANSGTIYLHDSPNKIEAARKRLARAGLHNVQFICGDVVPGASLEDERKAFKSSLAAKLQKLVGELDWVLCDVPCTGSGVWRRNPDMKWKTTEATLKRLCELQESILANALAFLRPQTGRLVYSTCSLFRDENEAQIDRLMKQWGLELDGEPLKLLPTVGGPDGAFAAVLRQKARRQTE